MEIKKAIGVVLITIGFLLVLFQGIFTLSSNALTGFAIAEKYSILSMNIIYLLEVGILITGILLFVAEKKSDIEKYSLEDIMNGKIPSKYKKLQLN